MESAVAWAWGPKVPQNTAWVNTGRPRHVLVSGCLLGGLLKFSYPIITGCQKKIYIYTYIYLQLIPKFSCTRILALNFLYIYHPFMPITFMPLEPVKCFELGKQMLRQCCLKESYSFSGGTLTWIKNPLQKWSLIFLSPSRI